MNEVAALLTGLLSFPYGYEIKRLFVVRHPHDQFYRIIAEGAGSLMAALSAPEAGAPLPAAPGKLTDSTGTHNITTVRRIIYIPALSMIFILSSKSAVFCNACQSRKNCRWGFFAWSGG